MTGLVWGQWHWYTPADSRRSFPTAGKQEAPVPIRKDLLEILVCPATKQPLEILSEAKLASLNALIARGRVHNSGGTKIESPVEEALITTDGRTIYRIDDGIPIMLVEESLPTEKLEGF